MFKLTITFSDGLKPEVEYFEKKSAAMHFAKIAYNNGYTVDRDGKTFIYPYYIMRQMIIEEDSKAKPERLNRVSPTQ